MRYLETSKSHRQKVEWRLSEAGRRSRRDLVSSELQFCKMKSILKVNGGDGCTTI